MVSVQSRSVYHAGQTIFREGDLGKSIFLVERGYVEIWRGSGETRVVLGAIPPGGVFGEMAIFDDGPRLASATATEETVVVRIPSDRIRNALAKADPILGRLIRVMLESTRRMAGQLEAICLEHAQGRDAARAIQEAGIAVKRVSQARGIASG